MRSARRRIRTTEPATTPPIMEGGREWEEDEG
jgi:hypothetical protein